MLPLGASTSFTGSGTNTGEITAASWTMKMTGVGGVTLLNCKGDDASKPASCNIGLGVIHVGKATYGGLTFPQESGDITLKDIVTIDLAKGLPSFALSTTTTLTTYAQDGKEAFCVKILSKPMAEEPVAAVAPKYISSVGKVADDPISSPRVGCLQAGSCCLDCRADCCSHEYHTTLKCGSLHRCD